jgi:hypothetical protein
MKKKVRALTLSKETLRNLEDTKLDEAAGGASGFFTCLLTCTCGTRRCTDCYTCTPCIP